MNKAIILVFPLILISCTNQNTTHKEIVVTENNNSPTFNSQEKDTAVFVYNPQEIVGINSTEWIAKIDNNCTNSLAFKNDTAFFYSCELDEIDRDPFLIRNDTIIIYEYDYSREMDTSQVYIGQSHFVIFENKLIPVYSFEIDENGNKIYEHRIDKRPRKCDIFYYEKQ